MERGLHVGLEQAYLKFVQSAQRQRWVGVDWEDAAQTAALEFLQKPSSEMTAALFQLRVKSRQQDFWRKQRPQRLLDESLIHQDQAEPKQPSIPLSCSRIDWLSVTLQKTLHSLVEHAGNQRQAAIDLGISCQTMRKRVQRIRQAVKPFQPDEFFAGAT